MASSGLQLLPFRPRLKWSQIRVKAFSTPWGHVGSTAQLYENEPACYAVKPCAPGSTRSVIHATMPPEEPLEAADVVLMHSCLHLPHYRCDESLALLLQFGPGILLKAVCRFRPAPASLPLGPFIPVPSSRPSVSASAWPPLPAVQGRNVPCKQHPSATAPMVSRDLPAETIQQNAAALLPAPQPQPLVPVRAHWASALQLTCSRCKRAASVGPWRRSTRSSCLGHASSRNRPSRPRLPLALQPGLAAVSQTTSRRSPLPEWSPPPNYM